MIKTLFSSTYTYTVIIIILGILIVYLLPKIQLSIYAKTMPNNYSTLKALYGEPLCSFSGTAFYLNTPSFGHSVNHPVVVDVYADFVIIRALGYASILNPKENNYVIEGPFIKLSYSKSPYTIDMEFNKDGLKNGEWEKMEKALAISKDTSIE